MTSMPPVTSPASAITSVNIDSSRRLFGEIGLGPGSWSLRYPLEGMSNRLIGRAPARNATPTRQAGAESSGSRGGAAQQGTMATRLPLLEARWPISSGSLVRIRSPDRATNTTVASMGSSIRALARSTPASRPI